MNERGRDVVLGLISGVVGLVTIGVLNLLAHRSVLSYQPNRASREPVHFSPVTLPETQQDQTDSRLYSSSNVLELPRASLDFVGYWGGSVRCSGSLSSHVGVVFGRRDNHVFFSSELYSPVGQHLIQKPRVKMVGAREVFIEYESEDHQVNYKYSHQFRLLDSGRIAYDETVRLYDRYGHHFLELDEQHSMLTRLTNIEEWRSLVRPAPDDVREGAVSTSERLRSSQPRNERR